MINRYVVTINNKIYAMKGENCLSALLSSDILERAYSSKPSTDDISLYNINNPESNLGGLSQDELIDQKMLNSNIYIRIEKIN